MYKLLLFIIIMQLLNVSRLMGFKIYASFIKNPALSIFVYFLIKNLASLKIRVSFICILIILSV